MGRPMTHRMIGLCVCVCVLLYSKEDYRLECEGKLSSEEGKKNSALPSETTDLAYEVLEKRPFFGQNLSFFFKLSSQMRN